MHIPNAGSAHPAHHASTGGYSRAALVALLTIRAALNLGYAMWLTSTTTGWSAFFDRAATYLAADGTLALITAVVLVTYPFDGARLLGGATGAEAIVQLCAAIALWNLPGITDFPVTAVAFFGIVGVCTALIGALAIVIRLNIWRTDHATHRAETAALHEVLDPLGLVGLVALIVVGAALLTGPPATIADYRTLAIRWAGMLAVALTFAALGAATSRRTSASTME